MKSYTDLRIEADEMDVRGSVGLEPALSMVGLQKGGALIDMGLQSSQCETNALLHLDTVSSPAWV